jgi:hypothetical protein
MVYLEGDVRAAVRAALSNVAEFGEDEQDELNAILDGAVAIAATARENRTGNATTSVDEQREDVADMDKDDLMLQFVAIAREKKQIDARDKALSKRKAAINDRLLSLAEQAIIMPPWKVDGATIYLTSRVWAKVDWPNTEGMPDDVAERLRDEARARAIAALKSDPDTAGFVKEDFNVQSLSSYFKEEVEHGRVVLDNGTALIGGAVKVEEVTEARVRGA